MRHGTMTAQFRDKGEQRPTGGEVAKWNRPKFGWYSTPAFRSESFPPHSVEAG